MRKSKKTKPKKTYQPDDKFFKEMMSRKKTVAAYLQSIHPEIAELVDLDTLVQLKESFLSPDLQSFSSDIIWRCNFKNSKQATRISFLWEHKMQESKNYAIQAGLYSFLYLHRLVNIEKKPLEPIVPLLYYNGKNPKWKPKTVHELFEGTPGFEGIKKYIPNFEPLFLNLADASEEEIGKIEMDFLRSAFYAMFWRHNSDLLLEKISLIFDSDIDEFEKHTLLIYYFSVFEKSPEKIKETVEKINFKNKDAVMSAYDQLIQKGLKEGIERGIAKGVEQGIEKGIQKGMRKGLEQGVQKGNKQTEVKKNIIGIKNMYQEGFPLELISKIQEVNKKFVEEIISCIKDLKNKNISSKTQETIKKISREELSAELIAQIFEVKTEKIKSILAIED